MISASVVQKLCLDIIYNGRVSAHCTVDWDRSHMVEPLSFSCFYSSQCLITAVSKALECAVLMQDGAYNRSLDVDQKKIAHEIVAVGLLSRCVVHNLNLYNCK